MERVGHLEDLLDRTGTVRADSRRGGRGHFQLHVLGHSHLEVEAVHLRPGRVREHRLDIRDGRIAGILAHCEHACQPVLAPCLERRERAGRRRRGAQAHRRASHHRSHRVHSSWRSRRGRGGRRGAAKQPKEIVHTATAHGARRRRRWRRGRRWRGRAAHQVGEQVHLWRLGGRGWRRDRCGRRGHISDGCRRGRTGATRALELCGRVALLLREGGHVLEHVASDRLELQKGCVLDGALLQLKVHRSRVVRQLLVDERVRGRAGGEA
mmetsp:Transcript_22840/g.58079  ORF Transcript_22840/g.58079 Transcript_22840/m.58079 type:complete len:267 (-) Transcript_22840:1678-2478(-)